MDRQTKRQKNGNATEMDRFLLDFFLQVLEFLITFDLCQWHFHVFCTFQSIHFRGTSSFHFCGAWSIHPFNRHFLYNSVRGKVHHAPPCNQWL